MPDVLDPDAYENFADTVAEINDRLGIVRRLSDGSLLQVPAHMFWPAPTADETDDDVYFPRVLAAWPGVTAAAAKKVWKQFRAENGSYAVIAYMIKQKSGLDEGE